jgi:hypothetical protein
MSPPPVSYSHSPGSWRGAADTRIPMGAVARTRCDGAKPLASPPSSSTVTGMAATPGTESGWLVAADGGVFAVSDAVSAPPPFYGSLPSVGVAARVPIVGIAATPDGHGYWLVGSDGGVVAFGDGSGDGVGALRGMERGTAARRRR